MGAAYRSDTPQCCACSVLVDDDHYYSFDGRPICYECFVRQRPPLPPLDPTRAPAAPSGVAGGLRRGAWWLHGAGLPGLLGLGALGAGVVAAAASSASAAVLLAFAASWGVVGWQRARRQFT